MGRLLVAVVLLAFPSSASAGLVQRPVQHAGQVKGTNVFVGIVEKPGDRFRAYVSDGTPKRATLSVWFRGDIAEDDTLTATDHGVTLAARIADDRARGTVTLPDGRVLTFGWIVLEDNRVRGRTMVLGTALNGAPASDEPQPGLDTLRVQLGRLLRQSGIWELRLNRGRGSSAAYNRLTQVIGFLDETILEMER